MANDIAKILGYAAPRDAILRHCKKTFKGRIKTNGGKQDVKFIGIDDVHRLIANQKVSPEEYIIRLLEWLKSNNITIDGIVLSTRREVEIIHKLKESLIPFNLSLKEQYRILSYRVDGYIPELNICIEFDEGNHAGYTYEQQEYRQLLIEEELKCKFIRVSDKNSDDYNIGFILKEILKLVVRNNTYLKLA